MLIWDYITAAAIISRSWSNKLSSVANGEGGVQACTPLLGPIFFMQFSEKMCAPLWNCRPVSSRLGNPGSATGQFLCQPRCLSIVIYDTKLELCPCSQISNYKFITRGLAFLRTGSSFTLFFCILLLKFRSGITLVDNNPLQQIYGSSIATTAINSSRTELQAITDISMWTNSSFSR